MSGAVRSGFRHKQTRMDYNRLWKLSHSLHEVSFGLVIYEFTLVYFSGCHNTAALKQIVCPLSLTCDSCVMSPCCLSSLIQIFVPFFKSVFPFVLSPQLSEWTYNLHKWLNSTIQYKKHKLLWTTNNFVFVQHGYYSCILVSKKMKTLKWHLSS